jgi:hypothetical protein
MIWRGIAGDQGISQPGEETAACGLWLWLSAEKLAGTPNAITQRRWQLSVVPMVSFSSLAVLRCFGSDQILRLDTQKRLKASERLSKEQSSTH